MPTSLDMLLKRSDAFEDAIEACFPASGLTLAMPDQRLELVTSACLLCVEHASALRAAFAVGAPNSGSAVLRLQFEALLRATWLFYAASPAHLGKLEQTLDIASEQAAKNLPGYAEMLKSVVQLAPKGLSEPIEEFNRYSRHALNSYVHSGIHPLRRAQEGYPLEMAETLVRFSNGLMHFAYRLLASLSNSQPQMNQVTRVYLEFTDCVPMA